MTKPAPKKPLQVGDRVRVYSHYGPYTGTVKRTGQTIQTPFRISKDMLLVQPDKQAREWPQHPRQCRRLITRKRREWEIVRVACSDGVWRQLANGPVIKDSERIKVREVKVRK